MSEALGPEISEDELNAITKTANLFEVEDASLQVSCRLLIIFIFVDILSNDRALHLIVNGNLHFHFF